MRSLCDFDLEMPRFLRMGIGMDVWGEMRRKVLDHQHLSGRQRVSYRVSHLRKGERVQN